MIAHRITHLIAFAAIASVTCACSTGLLGVPWIKQGPGTTAEEGRAEREAKARGEPPPQQARAPQTTTQVPQASSAAPARVRQMEVAPDLIAQRPPPPRSAAEQAASGTASAASYTQGTRYGDLVFISGQIALDLQTSQIRGATIEEQTKQAMENLGAVLESHRLTFANVVSVTVYLKEINDFRGMNATYESYFRGALPARSVVGVAQLPRSALVEISAVAGR